MLIVRIIQRRDNYLLYVANHPERKEYVPDPLGSKVALLDSTQAQSDTFSYWPYGEEQSRTGSTPTPLRFVGALGYYRDSATRTYVRARHLDVGKGRWLTQDPIGFDGGDWNLYRYVGNNPAVIVDPSGYQARGGFPPLTGRCKELHDQVHPICDQGKRSCDNLNTPGDCLVLQLEI